MLVRLDKELVNRKIVSSREQAKEHILAGEVLVNGKAAQKPSHGVREADQLEVRGNLLPYVSRGGLKLEKALDTFLVDVTDRICMDIGASTGGFTDCLLQRGAQKVFAVDVGTNQMHDRLRGDPRVVVMEQTHIRNVSASMVKDAITLIVVDVSFISLSHVLPVAKELFGDRKGEIICLVKPQFEAGPAAVNKKGVVTDFSQHETVLKTVITFANNMQFVVGGADYSPIQGPEGNTEYLLYLTINGEEKDQVLSIPSIVKSAKKNFRGE